MDVDAAAAQKPERRRRIRAEATEPSLLELVRNRLRDASPYIMYALLTQLQNSSVAERETDARTVIALQTYFMGVLGQDLPYVHEHFSEGIDTKKMASLVHLYNPSIVYEDIDWSPNAWGPIIWKFVHTLSVAVKRGLLPENPFYTQLAPHLDAALPCGVCRMHYRVLWKSNASRLLALDPVDMFYHIHTMVTESIYRARKGTPPPFSPQQFYKEYGERPCLLTRDI